MSAPCNVAEAVGSGTDPLRNNITLVYFTSLTYLALVLRPVFRQATHNRFGNESISETRVTGYFTNVCHTVPTLQKTLTPKMSTKHYERRAAIYIYIHTHTHTYIYIYRVFQKDLNIFYSDHRGHRTWHPVIFFLWGYVKDNAFKPQIARSHSSCGANHWWEQVS